MNKEYIISMLKSTYERVKAMKRPDQKDISQKYIDADYVYEMECRIRYEAIIEQILEMVKDEK